VGDGADVGVGSGDGVLAEKWTVGSGIGVAVGKERGSWGGGVLSSEAQALRSVESSAAKISRATRLFFSIRGIILPATARMLSFCAWDGFFFLAWIFAVISEAEEFAQIVMVMKLSAPAGLSF